METSLVSIITKTRYLVTAPEGLREEEYEK